MGVCKCFAADFIEAEKRGDLIIPLKGESAIEAIRRHIILETAIAKQQRRTV